VGKGVGVDAAGRLPLDAIVAHGCRRRQALLDVPGLEDVPACRGMAPDAGIAVGLQLHANRQLVGEVGTLLLCPADLRSEPQHVLHVMADLVGDHIGLGEVAGRTEAALQLLEEAEIEIDPLVAGAAGPFAFLCVSVLAGISYAVVVGTALAARRKL